MRSPYSILLAGLASTLLGSCAGWNWDPFFRLPVVCPSSVILDRTLMPQGRIQFRPYVQNRGVDDLHEPFNLYMTVTRTGFSAPVYGNTYIPNGKVIPGTHAVPGKTAGPEIELTSASTLTPFNLAYDPNGTYGVTLRFKSPNPAVDAASEGCRQLGPVNFKGGVPVP